MSTGCGVQEPHAGGGAGCRVQGAGGGSLWVWGVEERTVARASPVSICTRWSASEESREASSMAAMTRIAPPSSKWASICLRRLTLRAK